MNIGDDTQSCSPTELPERAIACPIEYNNPGIQAIWIKIVIINETLNGSLLSTSAAK
jgi:hypothetical protein